jgi:hypothetical protein
MMYTFSSKLAGLMPQRFEPISRVEPPDPPRRRRMSPAEREETSRRIRATMAQIRKK